MSDCSGSESANASVKDKIVNIFSFVGHVGSVIATQLCHGGLKAAVDYM